MVGIGGSRCGICSRCVVSGLVRVVLVCRKRLLLVFFIFWMV